MLCLATRSGPTLCDAMVCNLPGSFVLGASPGKNTGVGCLHGIFTIQGLNPGPRRDSTESQPLDCQGIPFNNILLILLLKLLQFGHWEISDIGSGTWHSGELH